ncbi:MAG: tRNA epoxyqueuosine(34) reductase QueG [Gammaproteobacteria bacterium]
MPDRRPDIDALPALIRTWAGELGFQQTGIADTDLGAAEPRLQEWLGAGYAGDMAFMARHGRRRTRPGELVPDTIRVISARMNYLPYENPPPATRLENRDTAYIARYTLGRDYHKLMRRRLQRLADRIEASVGTFGYRVFVDSAPVLEKPLAQKAGLGWLGKHTNLINRDAGSWFLLGEIYTDLPLPVDTPAADHCGTCRACIDVCPTRAIVAPYVLDARRCISYLTIELRDAIPLEFRRAIGNRVFGCDDCQLFCPWNKFARHTEEPGFQPRHGLDSSELVPLFAWTREQWDERTRGSAIRRAGYEGWLRNLAVALGNATTSPRVIDALRSRREHESALVREHVGWALAQHGS